MSFQILSKNKTPESFRCFWCSGILLKQYWQEGEQENVRCEMGYHCRLEPLLPKEPSENDSSYAIQDNRAEDDQRTQYRQRCRDGQVSQAEDDNRYYYSCLGRLIAFEQLHTDPYKKCHQKQSHQYLLRDAPIKGREKFLPDRRIALCVLITAPCIVKRISDT